jgi:ketosteroid isomerase-like protein
MNRSFGISAAGLPLMLAALSLTGCTTQHDAPLPTLVTSALENAFNKGDVAACADLYTDDAEIISNHTHIFTGKPAIEQFFRDQVSSELLFDTDTKLSVVSGDVAMEQGTYRIRNVVQGVDVEHGDYLNVWRKTSGKWKAYRSMYNVTQSPAALVSIQPDNDDRTSSNGT